MTDQVEKDTAFPILSDVDKNGNFGVGPSKWSSALGKEVKGIEPAAQTEIELLQPYKRGQAYDTDPLWRLGQLNNIDKHRLLHVVRRALAGSLINVPGTQNPKGWKNVAMLGFADGRQWALTSGGEIPPKGRALVARWAAVPIDPAKPMQMDFEPVLDVSFAAGTPLVAETPVVAVLTDIRDHIVGRVLPPLSGFLK